MNADSNRTENWTPCDPGSLQTFGRRSKGKRRFYAMTRAGAAAAVVLCIAGLTVWSVGRLTGEREYYFGGIACHEVRANLEAFAMGTLPDDLTQRIEAHLKECPACQEFKKQMNQQQASAFSRQATICSCPLCLTLVLPVPGTSRDGSAHPHLTESMHLALAQSP